MGFIEDIATHVMKIAPEYNVKVCSPIIAQACLESGYGTSNKAKHNNFFGLKYRPGRVTCHSGYFLDGSSEQLPDGSYEDIECKWYSFASMEDGVKGYFEFISISRYDNLRGISNPFEYIKNLKEDGYATSLSYTENLTRLIEQYDLIKYDRKETIMADSNLVIYERNSEKCNDRDHKIDRITIHCYVGNVTAQQGVDYLCNTSREASVNYVIGIDGIGLMIPESKRAWTSSSWDNDRRSITIETACDSYYPYAVKDDVLAREIDLVEDIMRRYGKNHIVWIEDKDTALNYEPKDNEVLMTIHRWFAATACPGDYLLGKMGYIADEVNRRLNSEKPDAPIEDVLYRVQVGAYSVLENALAMKSKLEGDGFSTYLVENSGLYKVQTGAFKNRDNAYSLSTELEYKGYDTYITTKAGTPVVLDTSEPEPEPDIDALARAVIKGDYGNGQARKDALGDLYARVQARVNEILS